MLPRISDDFSRFGRADATAPRSLVAGLAIGEIVMDIKASGRAALIIAAGLSVGLWCIVPATPSLAAPQAAASDSAAAAKPAAKKKTVKHRTQHSKKKQAATKPVVKSPVEENSARSAQTEPKPLADASGALPASIANANAEASPADAAQAQPGAPTPSAEAPTAPAPTSGEPAVIAADEVNDIDRAASDAAQQQAQVQQQQPAPNDTATVAQSQSQSDPKVEARSQDDDAWDKASLIGKIFIAAGGLLTLASAARMFMA
jgi:hypothetical protein